MVETVRVYVVTHPRFSEGADIADQLVRHFESVSDRPGKLSITTRIRSAAEDVNQAGGRPPLVDLDAAQASIVLLLAEKHLKAAFDDSWAKFRDHLAASFMEHIGDPANQNFVLPLILAIDAEHGDLFAGSPDCSASGVHRERVHDWHYDVGSPQGIAHILLQAYRLILTALKKTDPDPDPNADPVHWTKAFLSHAKIDLRAARASGNGSIVDWMRERAFMSNYGVSIFFDETHTAPGLDWKNQFDRAIGRSALIAVTTDVYATREVCRWELMTAKRHRRPILDVSAVLGTQVASFAAGGNVPSVRADPTSRKDAAIDALMLELVSEVARHELWLRKATNRTGGGDHVILLPRQVELLDVAYAKLDHPDQQSLELVYADPPLDKMQREVIDALCPPNLDIKPLSQVM